MVTQNMSSTQLWALEAGTHIEWHAINVTLPGLEQLLEGCPLPGIGW